MMIFLRIILLCQFINVDILLLINFIKIFIIFYIWEVLEEKCNHGLEFLINSHYTEKALLKRLPKKISTHLQFPTKISHQKTNLVYQLTEDIYLQTKDIIVN
jgi:hypothetical protein